MFIAFLTFLFGGLSSGQLNLETRQTWKTIPTYGFWLFSSKTNRSLCFYCFSGLAASPAGSWIWRRLQPNKNVKTRNIQSGWRSSPKAIGWQSSPKTVCGLEPSLAASGIWRPHQTIKIWKTEKDITSIWCWGDFIKLHTLLHVFQQSRGVEAI